MDWKHATELFKSHAWSKCHKDAAVLDLHCSAAARELAEEKKS